MSSMADKNDEERWSAAKNAKIKGGGAQVSAPYNFIEPPEKVLETPWKTDKYLRSEDGTPSHSKPFKEALSGSLDIQWVFEQPFLIGGTDNENHVEYAGRLVLPGTSIRGMIRNVLEIVTAARVVHYDREARFAFREMPQEGVLGKIWQKRIFPEGLDGKQPILGALLIPPPELPKNIDNIKHLPVAGWTIKIGKVARIDQTEAHSALVGKLLPGDWTEMDPAARYHSIGPAIHAEINCKVGKRVNYDRGVAWQQAVPESANPTIHPLDGEGKLCTGRVAIIGNTPPPGGNAQPNTSWIFVHSVEKQALQVPVAVMDDFIRAHSTMSGDRNALQFWYDAINNGRADSIPVTYSDASTAERPIIGLTRFMKVPHSYSVGEMGDRSGEAWRKSWTAGLDFVQALLGHVPLETSLSEELEVDPNRPQTMAWKSRVFFRHGELLSGQEDIQDKAPIAGISGAPRASFAPFYLRQNSDETMGEHHWSSSDVRLSGRKRYPTRKTTAPFSEQVDASDAPSDGSHSVMAFRSPRTFSAPIRLHNVHPVELGGLLWALGFGDRVWDENCDGFYRHALGRGKAQGYGKVKARLVSQQLILGDGESVSGDILDSCLKLFENWLVAQMDDSGEDGPLEISELDHVAELRAMADPEIGDALSSFEPDQLSYPTGSPVGEAGKNLAGYTNLSKAANNGDLSSILWKYPRTRK